MTWLVRPRAVSAITAVASTLLVATLVARAAEPAPTPSAPPGPSASAPQPSASATPPPAPTPPPASGSAPPAVPPPTAPPPATASAPASSAAPAQPPPVRVAPAPTSAIVHIATDYPGTYLEIRDFDHEEWTRACEAPCDRPIVVDGTEARVRGPNMTDSNAFRIEPGAGTARLRISGGSQLSRTLGLAAMIGGIPISLGGIGLYGYGRFEDDSGLKTAGIVTLAVGGALVLSSIPLLGSGRTSVRDGRGKVIARRHELPRF